jgi:hypothetical protein
MTLITIIPKFLDNVICQNIGASVKNVISIFIVWQAFILVNRAN